MTDIKVGDWIKTERDCIYEVTAVRDASVQIDNCFDIPLEEIEEVRSPAPEWQPIATVPTGTMVLLCSMEAQQARDWCFVDWVVRGRLCSGRSNVTPTHWMPLHAPPRPEGAEPR